MCTRNGIQTSFVQKGKRVKEKREKDFVRQELARVRATAMEESFGTQKEHYSLRRIKARKKETEILYIFFGIHTANVVQLAEKLMEQQLAEAALFESSNGSPMESSKENSWMAVETHCEIRAMKPGPSAKMI